MRRSANNRHPETLAYINELGLLLQKKGDPAAAELLLREALKARRETLGNQHPSTLISIDELGALFKAKGDLSASEPLLREALEVRRQTLGNKHPHTRFSRKRLDQLLQAKGRLQLAENLYGTASRWMCGATRSAAGIRARFAPRSASVAPSPSAGYS